MRLWALIRIDHRITADTMIDCPDTLASDQDAITAFIGEAAAALDLARPVILSKHFKEIREFGRTIFKPADFMEDVPFDRFEVELIYDKKSKKGNPSHV